MIQTQVTVTARETIAPAWWRLALSGPELVPRLLPGQFLLVRCADRFSCYLRRPVFPAPGAGDTLSLLIRPSADPGRAWLSTCAPGDTLDVIGPLGSGFPLPDGARNLLLVSDNQVIDPLLGQMERALAAGKAVALALGGSRTATLYPTARLPAVVEFHAATLDGSLGHHGPVTDLLPNLLRWADLVCSVGSMALYRALKLQAEQARLKVREGVLYGLLAGAALPCGVGACQGCTVETGTGPKFICVDGPVFDLVELG